MVAIVAAVFASMGYNDSGGFSWYLYGPDNHRLYLNRTVSRR